MSKKLPPGIEFEKLVLDIQQQLDPNAVVTHNEIIRDRIGQDRQFDVVIRGKFGGYDVLGVIECKDYAKKIGTPEIDAFVTKANDINANFKILISKMGFTKPAINKAKHYGIQTLSALSEKLDKVEYVFGYKWYADVYRWNQIRITLKCVDESIKPHDFRAEALKIDGKLVLSWYTNYLLSQKLEENDLGWIAGVDVDFDSPQIIYIDENSSVLCRGITFFAERAVDRKEKVVGVKGTGFFDWQKKQATFVPNSTISYEPISTDFSEWQNRQFTSTETSGFIEFHIQASLQQFEKDDSCAPLDNL